MTIQITIRHVPQAVRDQLAERAHSEGKSMQEYLLGELTKLAERPSPAAWVAEVARRKAATGRRIEPDEILRHRDADRR